MEIKQAKSFYYRVCFGDTIESVCKKFNTCIENITRNNYQIPIYAGEILKIETNNFLTHYVKPVETLQDVATKYKVSAEKICLDNKLINRKLFIGQKLKIFVDN